MMTLRDLGSASNDLPHQYSEFRFGFENRDPLEKDGSQAILDLQLRQSLFLDPRQCIPRAPGLDARFDGEDVSGSAFTTKANFPDFSARIEYNPILCAI